MNVSDFSVQLDLENSGIMESLEDQLLQGETEKMCIRAELYKLNVYGEWRIFSVGFSDLVTPV